MLQRIILGTAALGFCVSAWGAERQVATVDLNRVFRKDPVLAQQINSLKAEIEEYAKSVRVRHDDIKALKDNVSKTPWLSKERRALKSEIHEKVASLRSEITADSKRFLELEAEFRLDAYKRCQQVIARHCRQHGIILVLRISAMAKNEEPLTPEDIQQRISHGVVYASAEYVDITDQIILLISMPATPDRA